MNEKKPKSVAARNFGRKQMVQAFLFNVVLLIILVGIGQIGFFFYMGWRWIPLDGGKEMSEKFENWGRQPNFGEDPVKAKAAMEEAVVRAIRRRASINFPEGGSIRWELRSMGHFKDANEAMVERYELLFAFPLEVKILGLMKFQNKFRTVTQVVTPMDNKLEPFATAKK